MTHKQHVDSASTLSEPQREQKHTPGPWVADDGEGFSIWSILASGKLIAHVIGDSAETDANAALIAESPSLYKSLQDVLVIIDGALFCGHALNANGQKMVDEARAALAKVSA